MNVRFGSLAIVAILLNLSNAVSANPIHPTGFKSDGIGGSIVPSSVIFSPDYSGDSGFIPNAGLYPPNYEIIPNGVVIDYDTMIVDPTPRFIEPAPGTYINPLFVRTEVARQVLNPLGVVSLDPALLEATCKQDWRTALQIVDRTIAQTPERSITYRTELQNYRKRLQTMATPRSTRTHSICTGG